MAETVESIITGIFQREGRGYTNNPSDKGGPTKFGITLATLAEYRGKPQAAADVERLQEAEARAIYRARYVDKPRFNLLLEADAFIGVEVIDTGVNMGPGVAATFLQRALNVFNGRGAFYADLKVDGNVGEVTARALRAFLAKRGSEGRMVLLKALNSLQGARYIELAEAREANEDFVYGWVRERA